MKYLDYSEKKKHGKPDFPIQYYYVDKNHEQYVMPLHWHRELELIRVKKGTLEIYLNNVPYFINAHEHIIIQGGMLHRGVPHDCVYECVVLDLFMLCRHKNDIADSYIMPVINRKSVINPTVGENYELKTAIDCLFSELSSPKKSFELGIYSLLYRIFYLLYRDGTVTEAAKETRTEKQNRAVSKMLDFAQNNYSENVTLSQLAQVGSLSEKYLCRLFKDYTNMTPIEYINNLRIENACHLMIHSNLSVTESALESGFNDLSYFTRLFKRYKGVTPSVYKKSHNEKT